MHAPAIGCTIDELDTPALCIDLDVMEVEHPADGGALPPARHLLAAALQGPQVAGDRPLGRSRGAIGVTCAKLGEAEVMAAGGIRDMLIANLIVGPHKMRRLVELPRRADPIVAVDHLDQAEPMSQAMAAAGLSAARDPGSRYRPQPRRASLPGEPTLALAQRIDKLPGVELAGIMGYEGHLLRSKIRPKRTAAFARRSVILAATKDEFLRHGLSCDIVSAGGTGSLRHHSRCPGITEVQAGGLIFMDAFYRHKCHVEEFGFALKLITTVVSRPTPDRAIIDAGRKSQNIDVSPAAGGGPHRHDADVGFRPSMASSTLEP